MKNMDLIENMVAFHVFTILECVFGSILSILKHLKHIDVVFIFLGQKTK